MPISPLEAMQKYGARSTARQVVEEFAKAPIRGLSILPEAGAGLVQMGEDVFRVDTSLDDKLARAARFLQRKFAPAQSIQEGGLKKRPFMTALTGVVESLPYTLGTAGAGALVSRAARALLPGLLTQVGLVGGIAAGQTYKEAREAGSTPTKAGLLSLARGVGEAGLEFAPAEVFLSRLFGGRSGGLGRAIVEQMVAEGATEPAQQVWENLLAKAYDKSRTLLAGVPESAVVGALTGGLLGGAAEVGSRLGGAEVLPQESIEGPEDVIIREGEVKELPILPLPAPKATGTITEAKPVKQVPIVLPASEKVIPLPAPPQTGTIQVEPSRGAKRTKGPAKIKISRPTIRSVEAPIYRKKTPREVYRIKLPGAQEEFLLEIVEPKSQAPTEETVSTKRVRESYRDKKLAPEEMDWLWLKTRELVRDLKGEEISRENLVNILENIGWEAEQAENVADRILAGEVKPLKGKLQDVYDFKQKKRLERVPSVRFNVYTKEGDLIHTGYGNKKKILSSLKEIAREAKRGANFQEILNKIKEVTDVEETMPSPGETPTQVVKNMLLGEITPEEAVEALQRHGYKPEQAEATVNAAWEKYAETLPQVQAKDARSFVRQAVKQGIDEKEALISYIKRQALEQGMTEQEYTKRIVDEALKFEKTNQQLAYVRKYLNPFITLKEWKAVRGIHAFNKLVEDGPPLFSREDSYEDIRRKLDEVVKNLPKKEKDELARKIFELKDSVIPYDDEVSLSSDLVEDLFYRSAVYEAFPKYGKGMRRLFGLLSDESGEVRIEAPDPSVIREITDWLKLFSTSVPVLEKAGPETREMVNVARQIYQYLAYATAQGHVLAREYEKVSKTLPKKAQKKLAKWFKRNYDRSNKDRTTLRNEFHTFLSRNPAISKEKALKLFDLVRRLNDLVNDVMSQIEELYDDRMLYKINIIEPDAFLLPNGEVVSRLEAKYRGLKKTLKEAKKAVIAEIEWITQQGVRRQTFEIKKEGDWFAALQKIAKQRLTSELRPWLNWIPHYREVKPGYWWVLIRDKTKPKGEQLLFAKAYKSREEAKKQAFKETRKLGLDPYAKTVDVEIKQHKENPDSIPVDILPIEVEGWLARLGIDPDSPDAQKIIEEIKSKSGFYSRFIRSKNIEGWDDTLEGFLRGYMQALNSAMFTYQRLYAKKHMLPLLNEVEASKNYTKFIKKLSRRFVESYTKFDKLNSFEKWALRARAFLYAYALQNKATYVLQNVTEWIHAIPSLIDPLMARGVPEHKAIAIALKAFGKVFAPKSSDVKQLMAKARKEGLTDYKTWLKYELHPDVFDSLIEFITDLDILGKESEKFSSEVVFRIGLEAGKAIGLKGEELYNFAKDFLLGQGKIFMTKGNKINAFLLLPPTLSRALYPVFATVVADILGRLLIAPKLSKTFLFLLFYSMLAGIEGLPFINKKMFADMNNAAEVVLRKGILGLAGIDTGFLSLDPFYRMKVYLNETPYRNIEKVLDKFTDFIKIASIAAFIDILKRSARYADKYNLAPSLAIATALPIGGFQHILKGLIRATYGDKAYNKYKKQYIDIGWRPENLRDFIYETLMIPTASRFDAWERYKRAAEFRHRLWMIRHPNARRR